MKQEEALKQLEIILENMNQTQVGRRAFLASLPLLLASCASVTADRKREGNNAGQETSISVQDEVKMTKEVLPQMQKDYPAVQDRSLQLYISQLGNDLVRKNSLLGSPYQYSFTVVDVPYVNAFALPAGTVFVTAPLIEMADTEAELVGVIGHEVGHIVARHTAERMDKAKKEQNKTLLYGAGGGLLGGALGFGLGKLLCPPKDSKCMQEAVKLGAVAGVGGGLLIQKYAFMANSREDEMEADRIGFKTSVQTGYDKAYVGLFYEKLLKMEQQSKQNQNSIMKSVADAMSTHPPSKERVQQMKQMESESKVSGRLVSSKNFDVAKKMASKIANESRQRANEQAKKKAKS